MTKPKKRGRPRTPVTYEQLKKFQEDGKKQTEVAALLGIQQGTVSHIWRRLQQEAGIEPIRWRTSGPTPTYEQLLDLQEAGIRLIDAAVIFGVTVPTMSHRWRAAHPEGVPIARWMATNDYRIDQRAQAIAERRDNQETLLSISKDYGITRERVRQIDEKYRKAMNLPDPVTAVILRRLAREQAFAAISRDEVESRLDIHHTNKGDVVQWLMERCDCSEAKASRLLQSLNLKAQPGPRPGSFAMHMLKFINEHGPTRPHKATETMTGFKKTLVASLTQKSLQYGYIEKVGYGTYKATDEGREYLEKVQRLYGP